jgi:hypothetical protein
MTPAFRDLSNLVFSKCDQETNALLRQRLFTNQELSVQDKDKKRLADGKEDMHTAMLKFCLISGRNTVISNWFYGQLRSELKNKTGQDTFSSLYRIAVRSNESLPQLAESLSSTLFDPFRHSDQDQDILSHFKTLFKEKVKEENSLDLAAYIFSSEDLFSQDEKTAFLKQLIDATITKPDSFALKIIHKLIEEDREFSAIRKPNFQFDIRLGLKTLENSLKSEIEGWKKENSGESPKDTALYFADYCENKGASLKLTNVFYFFADLFLKSPKVAENLNEHSSSFFLYCSFQDNRVLEG